MNEINMKNMVVLKNLPSNIIDEAFVVLKSPKKVKKLEKVEKNKQVQNNSTTNKNKEYFLKEAEMLVNEYIDKIENKTKTSKKQENKTNKRIRFWAYISTGIAIAEWILLINN
ncbi:MAG: hypothetical protein IKF97_02165 [Clostridia bacterium]|nr:hypothetical protein [Clostridia bacterium]